VVWRELDERGCLLLLPAAAAACCCCCCCCCILTASNTDHSLTRMYDANARACTAGLY
jgi:hypothetical protein